ncbi:MAG: DUF2911 domain-containing protein [Ferruginibacter sp.]
MKKIFLSALTILFLLTGFHVQAQKDKSMRPSPPVTASQKLGETTVAITYSQPSVKGRTIGDDLEPIPGKVWRAGANEATVFETDKDILVEGKNLPKGKYGFFILVKEATWTIIFNKTWDQWGAFKYKETDDVLRVPLTAGKAAAFAEKLIYKISDAGIITVLWGNNEVTFAVK